jgi:hypothetical protein
MTQQQSEALRLLAAAIIEAIDAGGSIGTPSGTLYAGLMAQGCTLAQYEQLMNGLERAGMVTREGQVYRATDKGRQFAGKVKP